ncbi:uncharacterized protein LOC110682310 [Chenopodium quinoa]|nr:uncharacterized protein LOC110682310 [Chenopodium quinoa]
MDDDKENIYFHMLMRAFSFLTQLVLIFIAVLIQMFGSIFEKIFNGNIFRRKMERLINEESEDYLSVIGHIDTRMDLNKDIKHGDARYYPALSMMAAKIAYENELFIKKVISRHWNMEFVKFYKCYNENLKTKTTEAFIMREGNAEDDKFIVAFRGTTDAYDWCTDFDYSWCHIDGMGRTHRGFMIALGLREFSLLYEDYKCDFPNNQIEQDPEKPIAYYVIRDKLKEIMAENKRAKFIVTGHSLGGALAILFPAILAYHGEVELLERMEAVYTFGQPRVGNADFGKFMKKKLREFNIKYYRVVYGYDIVPRLPFDNAWMKFKHFGTSIHFNSFYCGKIVEEEAIKKDEKEASIMIKILRMPNEIVKSFMNFIIKTLNAKWELMRGLIIGLTAGPYYKEGWFLIGLRYIGILCPDFINHNPQDYVNSTMLGSQDLFKYCPH